MSEIRETDSTISLAMQIGANREAIARQQEDIDELKEEMSELKGSLNGIATKRQLKLVHDKLNQRIDGLENEIHAVEQRVIQHVNNKFHEIAGLIKGMEAARKGSKDDVGD